MDPAAALVLQQSQCIAASASAYGVNRADIERELSMRIAGRGRVIHLADGSREIGVMRIPESAMPALQQYGVTTQALLTDDCLSIQVGTYMMRLRDLDAAANNLIDSAFPSGASVAQCVRDAARRYRLSESIVWTYLKVEGGTTGRQSSNRNGTYDMGKMQINDIHLWGAPHYLARRGITRERLTNDTCLNIQVGTYLAAYEISKAPDFWTGVGNYHSKTPSKRAVYLRKFARALSGDPR